MDGLANGTGAYWQFHGGNTIIEITVTNRPLTGEDPEEPLQPEDPIRDDTNTDTNPPLLVSWAVVVVFLYPVRCAKSENEWQFKVCSVC